MVIRTGYYKNKKTRHFICSDYVLKWKDVSVFIRIVLLIECQRLHSVCWLRALQRAIFPASSFSTNEVVTSTALFLLLVC